MQSITPKKQTVWYTSELEHEGFPLMLRFPEKPDFDSLQDRYSRLLTIEHHFAQVRPNGLPESAYNTSLAEFDQHILGMLGDGGFPVLVETFAGKRTYYIYVTPELDAAGAIRQLRVKYPEHKIEAEIRKGSGWQVIRQYSEEYSFYKVGRPACTGSNRSAKENMQIFPQDENGDVFRRMQKNGDQLDKPRDTDFNHVFEKEEQAKLFCEAVNRLGYDRAFRKWWDEKRCWNVRIVVFMVPTHADVTRVELQLGAIAREFYGRADGWGSMAVT